MFAIGVILLGISSIVFVLALVAGSNDPAPIVLGSLSIPTNVTVVFLLGAASVLVFIAGLEMFRSGTKKGLEHRRDRKRVEKLEKELAEREAAATATSSSDDDASSDTTTQSTGGSTDSERRSVAPTSAGAAGAAGAGGAGGAAGAAASSDREGGAATSRTPAASGSTNGTVTDTGAQDAAEESSSSAGWKFWKS